MTSIEELLAGFEALSPEKIIAQRAKIRAALTGGKPLAFTPLAGAQLEAYTSEADILLFGGKPGGGKTGLLCGLGLNKHRRTLIVRREFVDLEGPLHTLENILEEAGISKKGLVKGNRPRYTSPDGRLVNFMGMGDDFGGKQGNPHDLIGVDEAAQLTENQVRMLVGWNRTNIEGQRCRVVLASNPPLDSTGDWLLDFFGPWLNEKYPNPALPGELRWFDPRNNNECDKHDRFMVAGVEVGAQSRTFIPASFEDNPYYDTETYAKQVAALPDSVRDRMISGNFMLSRQDDEWQCIPTAWVREAQARWTEAPLIGIPMCAIGVDVAQGGADSTVLAIRHDGWYAPLVVVPGVETPDGPAVAGLILKYRRENAVPIIDMGGGYGGSAYDHLKANGIEVRPYKGAMASTARTADRQTGFTNKRTEAYWRFREALDPSQPNGSPIALPDDPQLLADLTAPRYEYTSRGYKLESKEDIKERLGRSPDKGDAVVMAWTQGDTHITHGSLWRGAGERHGRRHTTPTVNRGYANRKK